jgi:hypothetical protein
MAHDLLQIFSFQLYMFSLNEIYKFSISSMWRRVGCWIHSFESELLFLDPWILGMRSYPGANIKAQFFSEIFKVNLVDWLPFDWIGLWLNWLNVKRLESEFFIVKRVILFTFVYGSILRSNSNWCLIHWISFSRRVLFPMSIPAILIFILAGL